MTNTVISSVIVTASVLLAFALISFLLRFLNENGYISIETRVCVLFACLFLSASVLLFSAKFRMQASNKTTDVETYDNVIKDSQTGIKYIMGKDGSLFILDTDGSYREVK